MTSVTILCGLHAVMVFCAVAAVAMAAATFAAQAPATPSRQGPDVSRVQPSRPPDRKAVYKNTPQGDLHVAVYLPDPWKGSDRRPAIVFFFGGAFNTGGREQFYSKAEYFASRGMVAFCPEYRVFGTHKTTMDKCVEDARSAMRWVRKHAAEWGVDPGRLVSSGGSAGGHLAAAVALLDGFDAKDDDPAVSCRPEGIVLFNPVLDTVGAHLLTAIPHFADRVPGDTLEEKNESLKSLSPLEHLKAGCPPAIAFYGTGDNFVEGARALAKRSLALGNRFELWTAQGKPHGFFNAEPWHQATLIKADEFLASLGYLTGPPTIKPVDAKAVLQKEAVAP